LTNKALTTLEPEIGSHQIESSDMETTELKPMRNQREQDGKEGCSKFGFILAESRLQHQKLIFLDVPQLPSFNQDLETRAKANTWNLCQNQNFSSSMSCISVKKRSRLRVCLQIIIV
jgi:hypothetical protein